MTIETQIRASAIGVSRSGRAGGKGMIRDILLGWALIVGMIGYAILVGLRNRILRL